MDFLNQYSTYKFERTTTTFTKPAGQLIDSGSPKTTMGSAFILLNAKLSGNAPCRLRLYADQTSRDIDANRPAGNYNISESVALISDIVLTNTTAFNFDPPILGNSLSGGQIWYHLSGSAPELSVTLTTYPIATIESPELGRNAIIVQGSSIPTTGFGVSGSITTSKSFIILSGSATSESRLRLYSRPVSEVPLAEQTRSFDTQSQNNSLLIADLMFDSASFKYQLVPLLEAYTWNQQSYLTSNGELGYILQNRSAGTTDITASLYIYSTEN